MNGKGVETSGTEHIFRATPDELAEAMVDPSDAAALTAYLGRGLMPKPDSVQRTDMIGAVTVDAIGAKEAIRVEAVEAVAA